MTGLLALREMKSKKELVYLLPTQTIHRNKTNKLALSKLIVLT